MAPTPWPTKLRTTEYPFCSTYCWTAWEMSETRLPGLAILIPSKKLCRVTSMSRLASGLIVPQAKVPQQSPWKPSR